MSHDVAKQRDDEGLTKSNKLQTIYQISKELLLKNGKFISDGLYGYPFCTCLFCLQILQLNTNIKWNACDLMQPYQSNKGEVSIWPCNTGIIAIICNILEYTELLDRFIFDKAHGSLTLSSLLWTLPDI